MYKHTSLSSLFPHLGPPSEDSKDTQVTKFLTQELRKEPFSKDFNLASFDCMTRDEILQIFNDVLAQLDQNQHFQIIHEDPADSAFRIMEFLRVLKYKPSIEDPAKYRDGIQTGRADIICPIMAWILERKDTLKTRAYLANFLVQIDIPYEYLLDEEIIEARQKYLMLIEDFKAIHKKYEKIKGGRNTFGLVSDMQNIEHDLECIRRRIEMSQSKYSNYPDLPGILRQAYLNRKARDKSHELCKQSHIEEMKLREAEDKARLHRRILKDLREKNGGRTAEGIVEALEENCEILKYICLEKIPSEVDCNERCITAMKLVENDPPSSQQELQDLKIKTQMVRTELHALESRIIRKMQDGDLQQLREQGEQSYKIRELKSTKLASLHRELYMQRKLLEHRTLERSIRLDGPSTTMPTMDDTSLSSTNISANHIPSDEQYRLFMKQMRIKAGKYKQMRTELARLQNEVGILASTKFILDGEFRETADKLAAIEARLGITGFSDAQEKLESLSCQKAVMDETNRTTLFEMSCMSKELLDKIALKKLCLEPLIKELQGKRLASQILEAECAKLKDQYQSSLTAAELDTCHYRTKLDKLLNEDAKLQLEHSKLTTQMSIIRINLQRAEDESQLESIFIGKEKSRGFKDKLLTKILEEERRGKALQSENEGIESLCVRRKQQRELWDALQKLLRTKLEAKRDRMPHYSY